jgi:hypothetical protein
MTFVLTAGQRHEATKLEALMEQGAVKRVGRGRPKLRPKCLLGDKAYSSRKIRHYLGRRGIDYTIPRRSDETRTGPFNRALYKERNSIERLINRRVSVSAGGDPLREAGGEFPGDGHSCRHHALDFICRHALAVAGLQPLTIAKTRCSATRVLNKRLAGLSVSLCTQAICHTRQSPFVHTSNISP